MATHRQSDAQQMFDQNVAAGYDPQAVIAAMKAVGWGTVADLDAVLKKPPAPTIGQRMQRTLEATGPAAGAMIGGTLALPSAPLTGPMGPLAGAALGGMAGATLPELTRPWLAGQPTRPLAQTLPSQLQHGVAGATGEAGGLAAAKVVGGGLAKVLPAIDPLAQRVQALLQRFGASLRAGQLTQRPPWTAMEGIAEGSLFGSPTMRSGTEAQEEALEAAANQLVNRYNPQAGNVALSQGLEQAVGIARQGAKAQARQQYQVVDALAGRAEVETSPLVEWIEANIHRPVVKRALESAFDKPWREVLAPTSAPGRILLPGTTMHLPPTSAQRLTFQAARDATSELGQASRKVYANPEDQKVPEVAGFIKSQLDALIGRAAAGVSPQARQALEVANQFYAASQARLHGPLLHSVLRRLSLEPDKLAATLLGPNKGDMVRAVKDAIDPKAWEPIRWRLAHTFLNRVGVTDPLTGHIQGRRLIDSLQRFGSTADEIFSPQTTGALKELGEALEFSQRKVGATGAIAIKLIQGGEAVNFILNPFGIAPGSTATVLAGPWALSKLVTSPRLIHLLSQGIKAGPGTLHLSRALSHLTAQASTQVLEGGGGPP